MQKTQSPFRLIAILFPLQLGFLVFDSSFPEPQITSAACMQSLEE